jgi:tetratricopeptide (TPR) repeat protein
MKRFFYMLLAFAACGGLLFVAGCGRCDNVVGDQDPIAAGWEHFRLGEFDQAQKLFELVRDKEGCAPSERMDAIFGLATVWDLRAPMTDQDKKLAAQLYHEVIYEEPDGRLAPWSMLALARMKHLVPVGKEPDYKAVQAAYLKVWQKYPESQAGQEAFIFLQATYIRSMDAKDVAGAIEKLTKFISEHPESKLNYAAWSLLVQAYSIDRESDKHLEAEVKTLTSHEIDRANPFIENSWSYWKIAVTAEFEVGDFELARKYYRKLMDEYPQDIRCYSCEEALLRMDATEKRLRKELKQESGE